MNIGSKWMVAVALCGALGCAQAGTMTCPDKNAIRQHVGKDEVLFTTDDAEWQGSDPSISETVKNVEFEAASIMPPKAKSDGSMGPTLVLCDYTGTHNGVRLSHESLGIVTPEGDRWNTKEPPSSCIATDPRKCGFSIGP